MVSYLTIAPTQPKMSDASTWPYGHCSSFSLSAIHPFTSPVFPFPWSFISSPALAAPPWISPHLGLPLMPRQENWYVLAPNPGSNNRVIFLIPSNFWFLCGLFLWWHTPLGGGEIQLWFQLPAVVPTLTRPSPGSSESGGSGLRCPFPGAPRAGVPLGFSVPPH